MRPTDFDDPNPFGPASEAEISAFEAEVGAKLPTEYRAYLATYNGAEFKNPHLGLSDGDGVTIDSVYGLHDGPEYCRLQDRWKLSDVYDLDTWENELKHFVRFADTGTGDILILSNKDGSVWLYEHDAEGTESEIPGAFVRIANDFSAFIEKLISEEEFQNELEQDDWFQKRKSKVNCGS